MWFQAIKLAVSAGSKIYANKQKTKMAMSDAQLMHASRMAEGKEAYQGKLLEARQSDWKDEAVLIILSLPIAILAWAVVSDDPAAMDKVKLFFDMFSELPKWFTNLWILVVASIYGIKGTQIFKNGGKKIMSRFVGAGKKLMSFVVPKPNVPKTKIQKAIRDLKISTQKSKAGKAKLDQTIFELKQNKDFTFAKSKKKSESNTEKYKRIQGENSKVIKSMLDKATEKKADGGRIGRKFGSPNPRKTNVQKIKETFGSKKNVPSKLKGFSKLPEAVQQKMNKKLARKV